MAILFQVFLLRLAYASEEYVTDNKKYRILNKVEPVANSDTNWSKNSGPWGSFDVNTNNNKLIINENP